MAYQTINTFSKHLLNIYASNFGRLLVNSVFFIQIVITVDVTWKNREIKLLEYSEKRKLTFVQSVEGSVQNAYSEEKAVSQKISTVGEW